MTGYSSVEFRPVMLRAKAIGRALLQIYGEDRQETSAELLDLLDIAEKRLADPGYPLTQNSSVGSPRV